MNDQSKITEADTLRDLYGEPVPASLVKEMTFLTDAYAAFIKASPFVVLSTSGEEGLDASPRGGPPGFVRVVDKNTLILPDRSGNNRVDSLSNVVADPRIAMLFLVPGVGETMRVNGRARVSIDPDLLQSFVDPNGKIPRSALVITIDRAYVHCSQSLSRSKLWDPAAQIDRKALPSIGQMLQACRAEFDGAAYDKRNEDAGGLIPED
ncbi:pyridoxamine 5'-phosphate oxidase family protein [Dongia sp.]|uniref:pyridoxamine 5'-phosphate oxidase family protein n=1 Tax=Dongia sp. TaxID=1977262 RepID=UPI0035B2F52A